MGLALLCKGWRVRIPAQIRSRSSSIRYTRHRQPMSTGGSIPFPDQPFLASRPLDPELLKAVGCFTRFEARVNSRDDLANLGMQRAAADLTAAINTGRNDTLGATMSATANMTSLSYPDCLPDRIELLSYLTELGFLHDDYTETEDPESIAVKHKRLGYATNPHETENSDGSPISLIMKTLLSKVILECFEVDTALTLDMMKSYSTDWLKNADTRPVPTTTFDEYMRHRVRDSGSHTFWWMTVFGHGTRMTSEEFDLMKPLLHRAERVMLLANDFYSWQKEKTQDINRITNLVLFYMKSEALSEQDAISKVKQMIIDEESHFITMRSEFCATHPDLAPHLRRLVNSLEPAIAGYHYWSATCPRYNSWKDSDNPPPTFHLPVKDGQVIGQNAVRGTTLASNLRQADHQDRASPADTLNKQSVKLLDGTALMAPVLYIRSLTSKNVISKLADAFNLWLHLPNATLNVFKDVNSDLQHASLILDDIQDGSSLRRGSTAAHMVFGEAQTINSALYMFVHVSKRIHELQQPELTTVLLESMEKLFLGQSWELNWRYTMYCPSEDEYFAMIDHKTGAFFHLLFKLMVTATSDESKPNASFDNLGRLLGRWYQVRDDYMNLHGVEYAKSKGFCEDLDEGKFSYPVVRCCASDATARDIILGIFREKQMSAMTSLPLESKKQILGLMERSGAVWETWDLLVKLQRETEDEVGRLEVWLGEANPVLRVLIKVLATGIPEPTASR
ncbi:Quiannulatene synthase [Cladobotryum mycophilum]|uniref:Quiannulatene synthase n=1 Tax=Cladobotryum mycophilum TaxID=491253 RepID=A0ABR0T5C0_9HYPO